MSNSQVPGRFHPGVVIFPPPLAHDHGRLLPGAPDDAAVRVLRRWTARLQAAIHRGNAWAYYAVVPTLWTTRPQSGTGPAQPTEPPSTIPEGLSAVPYTHLTLPTTLRIYTIEVAEP